MNQILKYELKKEIGVLNNKTLFSKLLRKFELFFFYVDQTFVYLKYSLNTPIKV